MPESSPHSCITQPEVSVILSTYNRVQFLPQAIESIVQQTYQNFELLVVDDSSSDSKVLQCARRYAEHDARIHIIEQAQNGGLANSRNVGLRNARGQFVALMDDDDISHPERLERQLAFLKAHPEFAAVGCILQRFRNEPIRGDIEKGSSVCCEPCPGVDPIGVHCGGATNASAMIRREALLAVGGWRTWFPFAEDFDLSLRLIEKYPLAILEGEPLYYYRRNSGNQTSVMLRCWKYALVAIISAHLRRLDNADPIRHDVAVDDVLALIAENRLASDARAYIATMTSNHMCVQLAGGDIKTAWQIFKWFSHSVQGGSKIAILKRMCQMLLEHCFKNSYPARNAS